MKLVLANQNAELNNTILKKLSDGSLEHKSANANELEKELREDDLVLVLKSSEPEEIILARKVRSAKFEERLQNIVIVAGIPPHVVGFRYLIDAVKAAYENPRLINEMTKGLYPLVAEKNETSPSKVERAIRHAIDVSYERGKIVNLNGTLKLDVFRKEDKPTNGELIALIADRLLLEFGA